MVDANNLSKYNVLWLGTMLSQETRVTSEAETIERTAYKFRTGWIPANHKTNHLFNLLSIVKPPKNFLGGFI